MVESIAPQIHVAYKMAVQIGPMLTVMVFAGVDVLFAASIEQLARGRFRGALSASSEDMARAAAARDWALCARSRYARGGRISAGGWIINREVDESGRYVYVAEFVGDMPDTETAPGSAVPSEWIRSLSGIDVLAEIDRAVLRLADGSFIEIETESLEEGRK